VTYFSRRPLAGVTRVTASPGDDRYYDTYECGTSIVNNGQFDFFFSSQSDDSSIRRFVDSSIAARLVPSEFRDPKAITPSHHAEKDSIGG
jgi:hypothetical protein